MKDAANSSRLREGKRVQRGNPYSLRISPSVSLDKLSAPVRSSATNISKCDSALGSLRKSTEIWFYWKESLFISPVAKQCRVHRLARRGLCAPVLSISKQNPCQHNQAMDRLRQ